MAHFLRIGTRGSALALAQAAEVRQRLAQAHGVEIETIVVEVIKTTGDLVQDRPLSEIGGKGLFTKEIEDALLVGQIDVAVHSSKDMPTVLPDGLGLTAFLAREDARDAFIGRNVASIAELPQGATIGSSSLRRTAMLLRERPDLRIVPFRGNVPTRLKKLEEGQVDGTLLAYAGLKRLGLAQVATELLPVERFLPAVGQGAIALETRLDDRRTRQLLNPLNHADTMTALRVERAFLAVLDGSCKTPIAGYAQIANGLISFDGIVLKQDGSQTYSVSNSAPEDDMDLGHRDGLYLKTKLPEDFFT